MMTLTTIALWAVRLTGAIQVVVGLLFWSGRAFALLPLHMMLGMVFVLGLLALAIAAARARLRPKLVASSIALAIMIPVFGMTQTQLLPGPAHWVVRLTHLLIGIAAMIVAARLARFIRSHPRRAPAPAGEPLPAG
jgi:hypothetical protein